MDPRELTFPLVPRWRPVGSPYGRLRAIRRGIGSDVAGTRGYRPGDDPGGIDWKTSARLSSLRGEDDFIVRENYADEAPRAVVVCDRRPSMALYPPSFPWLRKPQALRSVWSAVAATLRRELGLTGYLDVAGGEPAWTPPSAPALLSQAEERAAAAPFDAPEDGLERAFRYLLRIRRSLPPGTFVFVCSDFLVRPAPEWWLHALAHRWDVVPVVIQDAVWEQSFPIIDSLVVPLAEPGTGRVRSVRLRRAEAEGRRRAHERRFDALLDEFRSLGLEPVSISDGSSAAALAALAEWGEARLAARRGEW